MNEHNTPDCYCDLFRGDGMPKGAVCKPCFEGGCPCEDIIHE